MNGNEQLLTLVILFLLAALLAALVYFLCRPGKNDDYNEEDPHGW